MNRIKAEKLILYKNFCASFTQIFHRMNAAHNQFHV